MLRVVENEIADVAVEVLEERLIDAELHSVEHADNQSSLAGAHIQTDQ